VFPLLTTGFQNIGIGNTIATSMTTGYNNVFIGNNVATSATSTGNTVAIGTNAGRGLTTGINNTFLGAFTSTSSGAFNNSTAIGYGSQITANNQIKIGTASETVDISGTLTTSTSITFNSIIKCPNFVGLHVGRLTSNVSVTNGANVNCDTTVGTGFNFKYYNSGDMDANGVFTAPVAGYYYISASVGLTAAAGSAIYTIREGGTGSSGGTFITGGTYTNTSATSSTVSQTCSGLYLVNAGTSIRLAANSGGVSLIASAATTPMSYFIICLIAVQ
jgi:hypothetical protein